MRHIVLTGDIPKREREARFDKIKSGYATVTIATQSLLAEGVDIPGWGLLILGAPLCGGPRTLQSYGRIMRPSLGKLGAMVIDLIDDFDFSKAAARMRRNISSEYGFSAPIAAYV